MGEVRREEQVERGAVLDLRKEIAGRAERQLHTDSGFSFELLRDGRQDGLEIGRFVDAQFLGVGADRQTKREQPDRTQAAAPDRSKRFKAIQVDSTPENKRSIVS